MYNYKAFWKILGSDGLVYGLGYEEKKFNHNGAIFYFSDKKWRYVGIEIEDIEQNFDRSEEDPLYADGWLNETLVEISLDEAIKMAKAKFDEEQLKNEIKKRVERITKDYGDLICDYGLLHKYPPLEITLDYYYLIDWDKVEPPSIDPLDCFLKKLQKDSKK